MSQAVVAAVVALALVGNVQDVHACACCDGGTSRKPVGWSKAGDAILVDAASRVACELTRRLEIHAVGAAEPAGCYDLFGDPDRRISCGDVESRGPPERSPRTSRRLVEYARRAAPLEASRVRVQRTRAAPDDPNLGLVVSVSLAGRWRDVWKGTIHSREAYVDDAGQPHAMPVRVTVWPTPGGDRAMMLIENEDTGPGTGHWDTTVRWIALPR